MNKKIFRPISILILIMALSLSACGTKDKVTVQLSWFHSAEFIGFYVADQLGYYADQNLDVTLIGGGPEIDPASTVTAGTSQFGVTSGDSIIRAQYADQDLIAVSSIFRKSPLIIMALTDAKITAPKDLAGKTIGVISTGLDTTWDIQLIAMLKKTGVDPAGIKFVPNEEFYGAADLHTGRMDASSGTFSTNELVQAKIDNELVTPIYYSEYGVEFYNNVIFTSTQLSTDNPGLVQRFIQATLQGYQFAIENPKEAAALTVQYDENLDVSFQQATIEAQIPLIDTGDAPIGWMDENVWANSQTILLDQGYITSPVDLTKVYTNSFIK